MTSKTFCSICLSTSPCEGDVMMKLWGTCATAVRPTDRAGPLLWPSPPPPVPGLLSPKKTLTISASKVRLNDAESQRRNEP